MAPSSNRFARSHDVGRTGFDVLSLLRDQEMASMLGLLEHFLDYPVSAAIAA
jgi:hypothetical protein